METARSRIDRLDERLGQNMLSRVLLHMVNAARPMDNGRYLIPFHPIFQPMDNFAIRFPNGHIDNGDAVDRACVVRLPARGGIEVGLVENNAVIFRRFDDAGIE